MKNLLSYDEFIENGVTEKNSVSMTTIIEDMWTKYRKDKDWLKHVTNDLKVVYGLTDKKDKRTVLVIINTLSGPEYFDIL